MRSLRSGTGASNWTESAPIGPNLRALRNANTPPRFRLRAADSCLVLLFRLVASGARGPRFESCRGGRTGGARAAPRSSLWGRRGVVDADVATLERQEVAQV